MYSSAYHGRSAQVSPIVILVMMFHGDCAGSIQLLNAATEAVILQSYDLHDFCELSSRV